MKIQTKTSCPLCGVLPDQSAWDAEHIIPSGIGGRRTLRNLYCTACNRRTGEQWDNSLRDELHHFLVMFGVKRDRKPLPALILDNQAGGKVRVEADGTLLPLGPKVVEEVEGNLITLHINATSREELANLVRRWQRKYPNLSDEKVAKALAEAELTLRPVQADVVLSCSFGNPGSQRSAVKSMLTMAVASGILASACTDALAFLRGEVEVPPYGLVSRLDPIKNRPAGRVLHCVAIAAIPSRRIILGYVEYLSLHRVLCVLAKDYDGPSVRTTSYAVDPVLGTTVDVEVNLESLKFDIEPLFDHSYLDDDSLKEILCRAGYIGYTSLQERQLTSVIGKAVGEACRLLGVDTSQPDAPIDPDLVPRINFYVHQHVTQFKRMHGLPMPRWPFTTPISKDGMEDIHSIMFDPQGPPII